MYRNVYEAQYHAIHSNFQRPDSDKVLLNLTLQTLGMTNETETERRATRLAGMTCDGAFDLMNTTKHQNSSPVHPNCLDC